MLMTGGDCIGGPYESSSVQPFCRSIRRSTYWRGWISRPTLRAPSGEVPVWWKSVSLERLRKPSSPAGPPRMHQPFPAPVPPVGCGP